jgi:cell division protein FtsB
MPSARSASAAARSQRAARAPRVRPHRGPRLLITRSAATRVRWDRVGRVGLLIVLGVVVVLYFEHTLSYISTRQEAGRESGIVQKLVRDNAGLMRQEKSLTDPATIQKDARALGMVRPGERPYVITGLPNN